ASKHVLEVLESAEANAQFKGLTTADLVVHHAAAQQGPTARGQGRTGGWAKRTHVEIVLAALGKKAAEKKTEKKAETKPAQQKKPEAKK
ncbi:MAG TPA: uL22 family ribosomal protein, partial [Candidatus Binatia bacterium]|nr:uL22 family ribosomal protein [Candidatus Binatia bacterium]